MFGIGEGHPPKRIHGQEYEFCGETDKEEEIEQFKLWCKTEGHFHYVEPKKDHVVLWARPGKGPPV